MGNSHGAAILMRDGKKRFLLGAVGSGNIFSSQDSLSESRDSSTSEKDENDIVHTQSRGELSHALALALELCDTRVSHMSSRIIHSERLRQDVC